MYKENRAVLTGNKPIKEKKEHDFQEKLSYTLRTDNPLVDR